MDKIVQTNRWLLVTIAVLLLLGALKVTRPVTMPVTFAIFLTVLAWPLQIRLERWMPGWLALILTFLVFLLILAFFVGAMVLSVNLIVRKAPEYTNQIGQILQDLILWGKSHGLPVSNFGISGDRALNDLANFIGRGFLELYSLLSFISLVLIVLLFGLVEVRQFPEKLEHNLNKKTSAKINDSFDTIAHQFQRYIVTKTAVSAITGVVVGGFTWFMEMDFAFIWGLVAFLLNYIPSLGSIISTVLISLFAYIQFQTLGDTLVVLGVLTGVQFFFGNWLDPRLEGKYLSLPGLVVVLSVIFWGWLWGIPGALLGVPLTIGIVNALEQFERTRWIAVFLANIPKGSGEDK